MSALHKYDRDTVQCSITLGTIVIKQLCVIRTKPLLTVDREGKDREVRVIYNRRHPTLSEQCIGSYYKTSITSIFTSSSCL